MCGIVGFTWEDKQLIKQMTESIIHRGPDGKGHFTDTGISLGHRRLSIIDLSERGKQPMSNENGTIWITFNGEIYNFKELKKELQQKGHIFISNTDTEVILHGYEEYGKQFVKRLNGMFAFGLWDQNKKELILARDKVGIKPLYYTFTNEGIIFASEIKALLVCHSVTRELNKEAVDRYFALKIVPGKNTMFKGIYRLEPGNMLIYSKGLYSIQKYWDLFLEEKEEKKPAELYRLFLKSVDRMLMSDVPLGVYLSGGLDSSAIVGAMKTLHPENEVHTFTMGFDDLRDEYNYARKVANAFGTTHHELIITFKNMTKALPEVIWHLDEPLANPALVPTHLLSAFAKKNITVALMGQGSDELFAGYNKSILLVSPKWMPKTIRWRRHRSSEILFADRRRMYNKAYKPLPTYAEMEAYADKCKNILNKGLIFDIKEILPNFILNEDDKLTMSSAIEGRVPFLDGNIIDFASKLPEYQKINNKNGKFILKQATRRLLPNSVLTDKKRHFYTPIKDWLNTDLLPVAENLLSESEVLKRGIFSNNFVKQLFRKHKTSIRRYKYANQIFALLMFDMWHRTFIEQEKIRI